VTTSMEQICVCVRVCTRLRGRKGPNLKTIR
jgi:hypothetical protein